MIRLNLKTLMARYDVSQEALAKECGVSSRLISEWANNRKWPQRKNISEILKALRKLGMPEVVEAFPIAVKDLIIES
ncbi:MAG: helix-turn-helix transcriptional regulator [Leptolyngbya sp. SIO3F4]|nr:helix-turn-helix transcriptional regulator [Leptolyngbya sp. SIO3F4]